MHAICMYTCIHDFTCTVAIILLAKLSELFLTHSFCDLTVAFSLNP